jgi:hypothetical protein
MRRLYHFVLMCGLLLTLSIVSASAQGFTAPLFGLTTAPNGDILVADGGAGVVVFDGQATLDISLPQITDLSPIGRSSLWVTRNGTEPEEDSGQSILRISNGRVRMIANLFAFEDANDPDGAGTDSNPFDIQSLGGNAALVVDAGGNDLLRVDGEGAVEVLAVFPDEMVSTQNLKNLVGCPSPHPLCGLPDSQLAQAVPTSVAVGPDGYYYVGELKGFPAPSGESRIWRVAPWASKEMCDGMSANCELVFDGGFTSIIDLAFGPDGQLYVAELDEQSWFAVEVLGGGIGGAINACDIESLTCVEVDSGIHMVTAVTFGKDGRLWATENALLPGQATVIEIP